MAPSSGSHGGSLSPGTPAQSRALFPWYVGWIQLSPAVSENDTPDTPTPSVNGQSLSGPALQASMSMLSLAPAASICTAPGRGSTATAGSFLLVGREGARGAARRD